MSQVVIEAGGQRYTVGLVTERSPTPSFTVTLNTPSHAYLLKGNAVLYVPCVIIQVKFAILQFKKIIMERCTGDSKKYSFLISTERCNNLIKRNGG